MAGKFFSLQPAAVEPEHFQAAPADPFRGPDCGNSAKPGRDSNFRNLYADPDCPLLSPDYPDGRSRTLHHSRLCRFNAALAPEPS